MKIVITQDDVKNNPNYNDPTACPMAIKLSKELGFKIQTAQELVSDFHKTIGKLNPAFTLDEFRALEDGHITEFVTEYTPNT